jgi:hypothetical protein
MDDLSITQHSIEIGNITGFYKSYETSTIRAIKILRLSKHCNSDKYCKQLFHLRSIFFLQLKYKPFKDYELFVFIIDYKYYFNKFPDFFSIGFNPKKISDYADIFDEPDKGILKFSKKNIYTDVSDPVAILEEYKQFRGNEKLHNAIKSLLKIMLSIQEDLVIDDTYIPVPKALIASITTIPGFYDYIE